MSAAAAAELMSGLQQLPLTDDPQRVPQLLDYVEELLRWNRKTNLTAITEPLDVVRKHLLDCLVALPLDLRGPICDVGSGAGLPGLLWAREQPELEVVSIDARQRKVAFQIHMAARWKLGHFRALHTRIEDLSTQFPVVVCRAFAPLPRALLLLDSVLAPDGRLLALKGPGVEQELAAVDARSWRYTMTPLQVPGLNAQRWVVELMRADAPAAAAFRYRTPR